MSLNTFVEATVLTNNNLNEVSGSQVGDILIKMQNNYYNKKLFFQSGINASEPGFCISSTNNVGFGSTDIKEKVDISGSILSDNYKIQTSSIPIIDINGNIKTPGNINITKGLSINNNKFIVDISGNTKILGSIDISNNLNLNNVLNIDFNGNLTTKGKLDISGNLNINNNFITTSSGDLLIKGLLDVTNKTTFNSDLSLNNGILDVGSNHTLYIDSSNNTVGIGGIPDMSYNFYVKGNTKIHGDLIINGSTTIKDTSINTITSFDLTNGGTGPAIIVNQLGDQPIVKITDNYNPVFFIANDGLTGVGKIDPSYNLDISGSAFIKYDLNINNDLTLINNDNIPIIFDGHSIINNNLDISYGFVLDDKIEVDASGNLDTSGNVIVAGTVTVLGNISQSGVFNQDGDVDVSGNAILKNNLDISENLRVNTDKFIIDSSSGNIISKGTMDISGYFNVNNKFNIDQHGYITSMGSLDISKNFTINQNNLIIDTSGNLKSSGQIDISNNFIVNSNKFLIDNSGNIKIKGSLDISNNLTINTNKFIINNSGSILSAGSIDISKNFNINTNKFMIDTSGNVKSAGKFDISKNLNINNNFIVDSNGNIKCTGNLDISNNFSLNTNSIIIDNSGNIFSKGSLTGVQNFSIDNDKFNVDIFGNSKSKGNFDLSLNMSVGTDAFKTNINTNYIGLNTFYNLSTDSSSNSLHKNMFDISGNIATSTGFFGDISDSIILSHRDYANNVNYLIKQTQTGEVTINSKSTTDTIDLCFDNVPQCKINSVGDMTINGTIFTYSDIRIKENIQIIDNALDKVKALQGIKYNLINEDDNNNKHIGLLAQDVEKVIPEVVELDGNIKTVAYNNLIGLLIQAIKELYNKYQTMQKIRLMKYLK
jgi:cytoskeletal protein CcmA (bactofilin family)